MRDSEIIAKISQGDEKALEYLYRKYFSMMKRSILKNNGTEDEAKDIFQDALIVFWQKVTSGNLVLSSKISTYLYSICQNLWRKELDRKKRLSNEEKDEAVFIKNDEEERLKIVTDCINQLGDICKKLLTYHYFDGLPMSEIADKLGFSNSDTAKTKKYKCKQRLYELIRSKYSKSDFLD